VSGSNLYLEPVELTALSWDFHVDRCSVCLARGNQLCYEGQYLADEVAIVRMSLDGPSRPTRRHPILAPERRPIFPGTPA